MHRWLLSVFFLASLLMHSSLGRIVNTIDVPGVQVGWSIAFYYSGENLRRVTFSVEDSIGKSLHFELRHNDRCIDNYSPQLLFNTNTNGRFDSPVIKKLTELTITKWIVEAKEDHWYIKKMNCDPSCYGDNANNYEEFTFDYRSPHTLSDVKKIRLYGTTCNGGEYKASLSGMEQMVPASFSQIHIRGRCEKSYPQMRFYFQSYRKYLGYTLVEDYISIWSPDWGSRKLTKPAKKETFDEVILQNIGGGKYKMTITVGDQETFEYVGDLSSYDIDQNWQIYIYRYYEITKFEIQY